MAPPVNLLPDGAICEEQKQRANNVEALHGRIYPHLRRRLFGSWVSPRAVACS